MRYIMPDTQRTGPRRDRLDAINACNIAHIATGDPRRVRATDPLVRQTGHFRHDNDEFTPGLMWAGMQARHAGKPTPSTIPESSHTAWYTANDAPLGRGEVCHPQGFRLW